MANPTHPDKIIEEMGGCGRFQIMINVLSHAMKIVTCFSVTSMIIISATPSWWCNDEVAMKNMTSCVEIQNETEVVVCPKKACIINGTKCSSYEFGGTMRTLVTEVNRFHHESIYVY